MKEEEADIDLPFLLAAAQTKQSYSDPAFMDDAYLYFVPDAGGGFLLEFHPIPYDEAATGNYAHRAGNFINQIFTGDYSALYPCELFGDENLADFPSFLTAHGNVLEIGIGA